MKPIYVPSGKAKEYGDYALNIYTGCPHRCYYCFAPSVKRVDRERFHSAVEPRLNIVEETRRQLEREKITGKLIHLCFTCDPYPTGYDTYATREIIQALKEAGNHVQILTKGDGSRDFDLLDKNDWYGITISGYATLGIEPNALIPLERVEGIYRAKHLGIKTWISCEPVINAMDILHLISQSNIAPYVDKWKIGKLNYHPSNINWHDFGHEVEALCKRLELDYYIKDALRKEMEVSQ
jgi:DNA repair photolyase